MNYGKCHTLDSKFKMKFGYRFLIKLSNSTTHFLILHEPNFFIIRNDHYTIPNLLLEDVDGKTVKVIPVEVRRINRPPFFTCEESVDYNFNECLHKFAKDSLKKASGCLPPWINGSEFAPCQTYSQCLGYLKIENLFRFYHKKHFSQIARCNQG